jgi:chromosome segregation ATPase
MKKQDSVGGLWKRLDDLRQNIKELNDRIEKYDTKIENEKSKPSPDLEQIKEWREQIKEWREQIKEWREQCKTLNKQVDAFTAALEEDTRRRMGDLHLEPRLLGMLFIVEVVECLIWFELFRPSESCAKSVYCICEAN